MDADLSDLLDDWPYVPGRLNVRLIEGTDGQPRIQVRLDLGILQMRLDGRPDGQRPHGFDSLLEYFEAGLDENQSHGAWGQAQGVGDEDPLAGPEAEHEAFTLSSEDGRALREEAIQYYHRYIALLALEDFDRVVRDTTRNLRVLDLCAAHAQNEADRNALEQFRPYITMVRTRALASQALKDDEPKAAILAIDDGLEDLRRYFADRGDADSFERSAEVEMLRGMRESLVPKLPVSQKSELRQRLNDAIQQENYELAAILRDELRMLKE